MTSNPIDTEKINKAFAEYLALKGLRKTTERTKIVECICRLQSHFDVETLQTKLEEDNFHVSTASIYNTLELLMNACIIVRHQFSTQLIKYELKSAAAHHHHVVCTHCGAVREIKNDKVVRVMKDVKITKFTMEYCSMYIYGICSKCKFRLKHNHKTKEK